MDRPGVRWIVASGGVILISTIIAGGIGALALWVIELAGFNVPAPWRYVVLGFLIILHAALWIVPGVWNITLDRRNRRGEDSMREQKQH